MNRKSSAILRNELQTFRNSQDFKEYQRLLHESKCRELTDKEENFAWNIMVVDHDLDRSYMSALQHEQESDRIHSFVFTVLFVMIVLLSLLGTKLKPSVDHYYPSQVVSTVNK